MTRDRGARRRVPLLCVASGLSVGAIALGALSAAPGHRGVHRTPPARFAGTPRKSAPHWPTRVSRAREREARPEDAGSGPLPASRTALDVARRFVAAFLDYELGLRRARAATAIRATAAPNYAGFLLRSGPREPQGIKRPPRGRLVGVAAGASSSAADLSVIASIARGSVTTSMLLLLERKDARWLVVNIAG